MKDELIIQGYSPKFFKREADGTSGHLEGHRLTVKKCISSGDAILSMNGDEILIPRFDNVCVDLIEFLRGHR